MKKLLLGIAGCVAYIFSFSQTAQLSGYVKDASTGETLIGASVVQYESNAAVLTNEYGFYSFQVPSGDVEVTVSYVGYQTTKETVTISGDTQYSIELTPDALALESVEVVYDEGSRKLETAEMSSHTLDAQTIKSIPAVLGEVDLVKSIQLLPGVTNNGEGSNGFNVRGGSEDQNLVLLDEAIIYNSAHVLGFFSVFNNDAIKDVKLYKGGIPPKFGGRVSSVLDVRQKDGNDKRLGVSGGLGIISSRLLVEGPIQKERSSFLVAGRTTYLDPFLEIVDNPNRINFYDLNAKASFELNENNELFLSGYFGNDRFKLAELFENSYGNETANLRWNHVYSNDVFSNLSLVYSKYRYNLDFAALDFEWDSGINNLNMKYDVQYFAGNNLDLNIGLSAIGYEFNPGEIRPTTEDSSINFERLDQKLALEGGLYASANQQVSPKLSAEYGVRYSNFFRFGGQPISTYANSPVLFDPLTEVYRSADPTGEEVFDESDVIRDFHNFEPRVALSYKATDNTAIKASFNRMAQYIHLISNTTTPTPLDVWAPSGPFFEPQLTNQFAAGVFHAIEDSPYTVELEGYYKTTDNRVDYIDGADLIGNNNIEQVTLVGEMESYGAELLVQKTDGDLTGWLSYTLARAQQRTPGGTAGGPGINNGEWYLTNFDRTHDLSVTGLYEFNDKWQFSSTFVFQTGRPVTYPNAQYSFQDVAVANFAPRNSNRLTPYHRLDMAAILTPRKNADKKLKGEWVFGVYNAYNRKNANSITFAENFDTNENEATRLAIFGIVPSATYNFKF
ncbi:MAG: TonB-dependent receptor [Saprospiraceae bacterium]|nr:TonB-dependent receptor [Saprospiraceae bacterium]